MRNHIQHKHLDVNLNEPTPGTSQTQSTQSRITSYTSSSSRRCGPGRSETLTNIITEMTARDMLPFSFVKGVGFNKLMNFVEPEYTVPGRKMVTSRIRVAHENMTTGIQLIMVEVEFVSITTDGWTSNTTESYMTITCHFIVDGKLESRVLQTLALEERHTAVNLADHLRTSIQKWGLEGKIIACVHDNASNITLANQTMLNWESVPCFAHTLQLAINDGLKAPATTRLIGAASRLVAHFNHSNPATIALKNKQAQQGLPKHKLIQSCPTRWNSVYAMLERLHEQRWAVTAVLSDRTVTKLAEARTLELTDDNWQTIETMLPVLESLKTATKALCSEEYVSLSVVFPVTMKLLDR